MPTPRLPLSRTALAILLTGSLASGVTGCGGSDGDDTTTITGSVFASAVAGASCVAKDTGDATLAGPVTTSASGTYSIEIPNDRLSEDLIIECHSGIFTDEATGMTNQQAGKLAAFLPGGALSANTHAHLTPDSTILYELVTRHGKTLADARMLFNTAFGYAPDHTTAPTDATHPAGDAGEDELLAGLRAAIYSQLSADLGLTAEQQFDLLTSLAEDLADGTLDGGATIPNTTTALPADIQNRFTLALMNFRAAKDQSGLTNDKIGTLPFAKMALTDSYKVEYLPGTMAAMMGKTRFKLRLTDHATEQAVSGETVTLMPLMYMAAHNHSTPLEGCTESATAGEYDCTIFYLMASSMMDGTSMGYWDLKVMIGGMTGESTHFYPHVMMAMGDTTRAILKGVNDEIPGMAMEGDMATAEKRSYYLFKSNLSGMTDNHTFQLFIAAKESMMSYPAVTSTRILSEGNMDYELAISSMNVEVSTDHNTWISANEDGNGYWTATGITGLTNAEQGEIYVRMSVNGEQKSTDGNVANGSNAYATFLITPGSSMSM